MSNVNKIMLADVWPLMKEQIDDGKTVKFEPRGRSMLPMLRPGIDAVMLEKAPDKLKKYDLPLYLRSDGHFVLHRVICVSDGKYTMCGDNQWRLEKGIMPEQILAVTQGFFRGEKYVPCDNVPYKIYCRVRTAMLNLRIFGARIKGFLVKKLHLSLKK